MTRAETFVNETVKWFERYREHVTVTTAIAGALIFWVYASAHHMAGLGVAGGLIAVGVILRNHHTPEPVAPRFTPSDYAWLEGKL